MTRVKIANSTDVEIVGRGLMLPGQVRRVEIEALVDRGDGPFCARERAPGGV